LTSNEGRAFEKDRIPAIYTNIGYPICSQRHKPRIRKINSSNGNLTNVASNGIGSFQGIYVKTHILYMNDAIDYVCDVVQSQRRINSINSQMNDA